MKIWRRWPAAEYARDGYPEWPRMASNIVANLRFSLDYPHYVGRFRDNAFPEWWRKIAVTIRPKRK